MNETLEWTNEAAATNTMDLYRKPLSFSLGLFPKSVRCGCTHTMARTEHTMRVGKLYLYLQIHKKKVSFAIFLWIAEFSLLFFSFTVVFFSFLPFTDIFQPPHSFFPFIFEHPLLWRIKIRRRKKNGSIRASSSSETLPIYFPDAFIYILSNNTPSFSAKKKQFVSIQQQQKTQ